VGESAVVPVSDPPPHPFASLDTAAVARSLSQLAPGARGGEEPGPGADSVMGGADDGPDAWADAFFERSEEVEMPADGEAPGVRVRREEGLAVRLVRGGRSWLAARDAIEPAAFSDALRQVARVLPSAFYPEPRLDLRPWGPWNGAAAGDGGGDLDRMAELPLAVGRAIRAHHVAFPVRLTVRRHRRWLQVVGPRLVPEPESERFFSLRAELPWGRWGTLVPELPGAAEEAAEALVESFRARHASPPEGRKDAVVVLAPQAAAVFLHEAVAHALEADTLGLGGRPEAAVGVRLSGSEPGSEPGSGTSVSVLDDPGTAPEGVRRRSDDEGVAVARRWLLRDGVVTQPLADRAWARGSEVLLPGAGRRAGRHDPPGPRSSHLELLAGEGAPVASDLEDLYAKAEGGFLVSQVSRGALDPLSGRFVLHVPCARRLRHGTLAEPVGPFRIAGTAAGLIGRIVALGGEPRVAGAGWCAKDGRLLPVWATAPGLRLDGVEVVA
jgi:predicted Zn-dependent protease